MQSMTRSVDAVEGVVVAKTMASGGTVSHSASAAVCGNQSSVVVNGCRRKRKGLPGLSTCILIRGKKKLCNSASEITKSAEAKVFKITRSQLKRKDRIDDEITGDDASLVDATMVKITRSRLRRIERIDDEITGDDASLVDAARALAEFSLSLEQSKDQPSPPCLLQWATTKIRSGRIRRFESLASNEDSHAIIASAENTPPLLQPQQQQVSECSSSQAGDFQAVVTLVKVEEGPLCSSTEGGEEQGQEQEQEQEDKNQKEKNGFLSGDPDRLHNLVSYSSNEFAEPDSRVESPDSPLPFVLGTAGFNSMSAAPKFEGSAAGRSAFQRVVPVRPVKKATATCKPKVEEGPFEALNPEQAAVKHVSRKKPRPTGLGQQQQLQHQHHHHEQQQPQQQLAPVKIEESDPFCTLALGPCLLSAEGEKEEVKKNEETRSIVPDAAVAVVVEDKAAKLDPVWVKVENKFSGRLGQRVGGKPKPALSESEKEARKQRRVQANRESARQTIRRKQVLCEELTRKSEQLTTENEAFRKELELMHQKHKDLSERNLHLKEQVVKAAANHEVGPASPTPSPMEKPPDGLIEHHFSLHQFGGMPFPPPAYLWAFTVAQAAGMQPGESNMGAVGYTSALPAAATAFGNNVPVGYWNVVSGSQGQSSLSPPFFPHQTSVSSVASTFPSTSATTLATIAPLTRSMSLPVAPADGSFSLVASERTLATGKSLARYRSGDFADTAHLPRDVKRSAVKGDIAHQGSGFSGRAHYLSLTPGSQLGLSATAAGSLPIQKSADGSGLPMSNVSSQLLGRAHSLAAPHAPKMVHSRYSMFGCGGIPMAQERPTVKDTEVRAAAAAKARRRRIELTRTKSLQHRHTARLAEPSA